MVAALGEMKYTHKQAIFPSDRSPADKGKTGRESDAERPRRTDRRSKTERIDRARDSGREQRGEGGRRYFTQPRQGPDVSICCCNRRTHGSTSAPQMSNAGTAKGQGTPSPSSALYMCAHMLTCVCVRKCVKWATVAKHPRGGGPVSRLSL